MVRLGTLPRMTMPIPLSASRDLHGRNMLPDGCHPGCERDHTIRAMQLLGARLQCNGGRYRLCPVERETTSLTQSCIRISRVGPCRLSAPLLQRLSLAQSRPLKRRTAKMILSSLRRSGVKRSCAFLIGSPHRNQRDQRSSSSEQLLKNSNTRRQPPCSSGCSQPPFDSLIYSLLSVRRSPCFPACSQGEDSPGQMKKSCELAC
jgi:hypothetical protein